MQGSLALCRGVVWIGREEKTAHVRPFDLDGRALGPGFSFRAPTQPRAAVSGIDCDDEHHLWIADAPARRLRSFSVFGSEVGGIGGEEDPDHASALAQPVDVALGAVDGSLWVASSGDRARAVQRIAPDGTRLGTLRAEGDPTRHFRGARRVSAAGRKVWVCETRARRVQVFRDEDFHFLFHVRDARGEALEPRGVAPLADGRAVVVHAGRASGMVLVDAAGSELRRLAGEGADTGRLEQPNDVVVAPGGDERDTRVVVIDRDGERVQVFTLDGRCYGAFQESVG